MLKKMSYTNISRYLRAKYYSFFITIGNKCSLQKNRGIKRRKKSIILGNNVHIFRNTEICGGNDYPLIIGNNVFINQRCLVRKNVIIGDNVSIGQGVSLITDSHEIGDSNKRAGKPIFPQIKINNGVWIGANSTILGGVTIGEGCIIGAGSVVNKDCEPNSLYAGVPAKFIKKLD